MRARVPASQAFGSTLFSFFVPIRVSASVVALPHASEPTKIEIRMGKSADGTCIAFACTGSGPPLLRAGHFLTHWERDWEARSGDPCSIAWAALFASHAITSAGRACPTQHLHPSRWTRWSTICKQWQTLEGCGGFRSLRPRKAFRWPECVSGLVLYGGYAQGRTARGTTEELRNADAILTHPSGLRARGQCVRHCVCLELNA